MKKRIVVLACTLLCSILAGIPCVAQTAPTVINGKVLDKVGIPIPAARVWIHEQTGNGYYSTRPDGLGRFSVQLPEGYYDIMVGAPGFAPFCKRVRVRSGTQLLPDIKLGADEDNLLSD
jgi:hypothetical protein